jgi:hypothetical protein
VDVLTDDPAHRIISQRTIDNRKKHKNRMAEMPPKLGREFANRRTVLSCQPNSIAFRVVDQKDQRSTWLNIQAFPNPMPTPSLLYIKVHHRFADD